MNKETQGFIDDCLLEQERGEPLAPWKHNKLIRLVDLGLLGMDGFRYMPVEEARKCWRLCHFKNIHRGKVLS